SMEGAGSFITDNPWMMTALSACGFIPIAGNVCGAVTAAGYFAQGRMGEFAVSLVGVAAGGAAGLAARAISASASRIVTTAASRVANANAARFPLLIGRTLERAVRLSERRTTYAAGTSINLSTSSEMQTLYHSTPRRSGGGSSLRWMVM